MKDKEIVELYWQRSDATIVETERKYGGYCHTIAYNILENFEDSEECVNDTWLGAFDEEVLPYLGDLKEFEGNESRAAFERQLSWVRLLDSLVADASVTFSDGRVIPVPGALGSSGNQESPFRLYGGGWEGTIPVADAVSVHVSGRSFDLPHVEATPVGG